MNPKSEQFLRDRFGFVDAVGGSLPARRDVEMVSRPRLFKLGRGNFPGSWGGKFEER